MLEIEHKYMIGSLDFHSMKLVWADAIKVEEIHQIYLRSEKGTTLRVRRIKEFGKNKYKYVFTRKKAISPGVNDEFERTIKKKEYISLLKKADPDKAIIIKTRYSFSYKSQIFELDIFHGNLTGIILLEIELDRVGAKIDLPTFLDITKDVTKLKGWKNSSMAKVSAKHQNAAKIIKGEK